MVHKFDAVILGAGAAGLMCAIEAGQRGRRVAVLEHTDGAAKKILISGGGRCNFTNIHCQPGNFISSNPHFAKSALARYTPSDFIALVEKHHIPYHEKTLGQLFCDRSARDIAGMLDDERRLAGVGLFIKSGIREVRHTTEFVVRTDTDEFRAPTLVVATGGLSIPKIGATSFGYDLARQFGLKIRRTRPALVPLVLGKEDSTRYCDLAGVSTEVIAAIGGHSFREKMLITHRGFSGPAILQISSYWNGRQPIRIDLAPDRKIAAAIREAKVRNVAAVRSALQQALPNRLAARWLDLYSHRSQTVRTAKTSQAIWTDRAIAELERQLHQWAITPADTEGYAKAEVTAGGIDTDELSAKTMESGKVRGLFFIGEVVDVTGQLGGYNCQWAWASGAAAGRAL